jgi:ribosome-binding protein aMBF1 (putative translation factor)
MSGVGWVSKGIVSEKELIERNDDILPECHIGYSFGEKLRTLSQRRGLSYWQLAASPETSHSHIINIETGKHKPSVDLIVRIVRFFGVSYDQLMDDDVPVEKKSGS